MALGFPVLGSNSKQTKKKKIILYLTKHFFRANVIHYLNAICRFMSKPLPTKTVSYKV